MILKRNDSLFLRSCYNLYSIKVSAVDEPDSLVCYETAGELRCLSGNRLSPGPKPAHFYEETNSEVCTILYYTFSSLFFSFTFL